jgi:hypothetical protein
LLPHLVQMLQCPLRISSADAPRGQLVAEEI